MKFCFSLCLVGLIGLGGAAFANQEGDLSSSSLIEKCGSYKILLEPMEKSEESKKLFPRNVAIIADRLSRHTGGSVVNFTEAQKAEVRFPNSKLWGIHTAETLDVVITSKGEFGIYEVVGRGEAGKYDGSDTVQSFPDFVKWDVHWYASKDPLIQNSDIRDATVKVSQRDDQKDIYTIDLHFGQFQNRSVEDFAEHVKDTVGAPLLAVLDGRALTSIMLTDVDPKKPLNFNPGFTPAYVQAFSSVIAHRVLSMEVRYKPISSSRPTAGVEECPVSY